MAEEKTGAYAPGIKRIDHGAVPVNDAGRAYRFYSEVLGAKLHFMAHFTNRPFIDGQGPMVFLEIAGHKGWGLALEYEDLPPPQRLFECPCWAFIVSDDVFQKGLEELKACGVPFSVVEGRTSSPIQRSVFFHDTEGNSVELCVRR